MTLTAAGARTNTRGWDRNLYPAHERRHGHLFFRRPVTDADIDHEIERLTTR